MANGSDIIEKDDKEVSARICPNSNCQYDHHQKAANFCILCGTLLYQRCDDCLEENPKYAQFCFYCGTSLSDLKRAATNFRQANSAE